MMMTTKLKQMHTSITVKKRICYKMALLSGTGFYTNFFNTDFLSWKVVASLGFQKRGSNPFLPLTGHPFYSPLSLEVAPLNSVKGYGEGCKLPQLGVGQSPS